MTLSPEELDEARAREACRLEYGDPEAIKNHGFAAAMLAARLARTGWLPTDPDLIEAREIARRGLPAFMAEGLVAGEYDGEALVQMILTAIRRGRELERQP